MKTDVYNHENDKVGTAELPEGVFHAHWNPALVNQVLLAQLANRRRAWAHAKGRGEVRGGGKKPWRQKGTGRARHGSIRSPLWKGGGKSHGPSNEKDYSQSVNKKMKRLALYSVLSKKFADHEVKVFDNWELPEAKTKVAAKILARVLDAKKGRKNFDVVFIADAKNKSLQRATSNLQKTKVLHPGSLNVYDLLNYKNIFIDRNVVSEIGKGKVSAEKEKSPK